ncbi:hypothetical protein JCGZ_24054 [Jatropha curcas]|uniref:B-like cyclin n=1 Tax=Jatropha curcas TaxID=180498 RepID=A0A067LPM9_JATCU|nr:uncharacterized protein LOC110008812 [Jatropha curcas]KDP46845.1 hypothetical protein JCGZ_24054 [Jatropha curcas]
MFPYDPVALRTRKWKGKKLEEFFILQNRAPNSAAFTEEHIQCLRNNVVRLICKYSKYEKFEANIQFYAVTYFDHFISKNPPPVLHEHSVLYQARYLAIACLSLASKLLTRSGRRHFRKISDKILLEMEFKIFNGLNWQMPALIPNLSSNSNRINVQVRGGIEFSHSKHLIFGAAAILSAINFGYGDDGDRLKEAGFTIVDKEKLTNCINKMEEVLMEAKKAAWSVKKQKMASSNYIEPSGFKADWKCSGNEDDELAKFDPASFMEHPKADFKILGCIPLRWLPRWMPCWDY